MKTLKEHPFFQAVEHAEKIFKKTGHFGTGNANRAQFYRALRKAHPFIFDRSVTHEKRMLGRGYAEFDDLATEFSIPFAKSLYLMTDCPWLKHPNTDMHKIHEKGYFDTTELLGYLIDEVKAPTEFRVFEVHNVILSSDHTKKIPCVNQFNIDLKTLQFAFRAAQAMDIRLFEKKPEAHSMKETCAIMQFTKSISVKRVGVEVSPAFNIKVKGHNAGVTRLKYDNIIHIADKEEYEYTKPLDGQEIKWKRVGWWRGHFRAFYVKGLKDQFGRNVVDYTRTGKNREGVYNVPGYTWVVEHAVGDASIADIKARRVVHE